MTLEAPIEESICSALLGGWMRVSKSGAVAYAQVKIIPSDQEEVSTDTSLSPIRWMLTGDQGIDLKTGDVYRDTNPNSLVRQLVQGAVLSFPRL
jgi:hypothetical protein